MNAIATLEWAPALAVGAAALALGALGRVRAAPGARRVAPRRAPARRSARSTHGHVRRAAATSVALLVVVVVGWFGAVIGASVAVAVRVARPVLAERRRRQAAHRALPDAVERFVLLVHAGLTPHLAVRAAADAVPAALRPAFATVVHRLDRGAPLADAVAALTDTLGPRAAPLADAIGAADRYGLPLEPMLDQLAREARQERRRFDEADARRLPVRLAFPLVGCTLPSFVLVAIAPAVLAALSSLGTSW